MFASPTIFQKVQDHENKMYPEFLSVKYIFLKSIYMNYAKCVVTAKSAIFFT
jgi:hypothetical protein